ncbi:MAG: SDR family NAD(P)-dependent oxidoreductase [Chitinophagales bacterium]|nr:SDR family NAD(P)-dependent oxidoreductase [Chitinophagales bacterium]
MQITGNTILITGGTSGIGLGLLDFFYKNENKIISISRDKNKAVNLRNKYPKVDFQICDLSKEKNILKLIDYCCTHYPKLNVVINNAGIENNYLFIKNIDSQKINDEIQINFISPIHIINGLKDLLLTKKEAAIINITSALAFYPKTNAAVYSASKAGLRQFTIALRDQYRNTKVRVIEVIPPLTDTPLTTNNPHKKISVQQLINEFAKAFQKNRTTIYIGYSKWVYLLHRISPKLLRLLMLKRQSHV